MFVRWVLLILVVLSILPSFGQDNEEFNDSLLTKYVHLNDGPYIIIEAQGLVQKQIVDGQLVTTSLKPNAYQTTFEPHNAVVNRIKKIAALSDIHGQYELAVELLQNNKIIDSDLNWKFGKGHLVIVGDIFDRGGKVNETLWLIYRLEGQAKEAGGAVHFTVGNHEYLILHNDLRYIHEKYEVTCKLMDMTYPELYGENTVMGRWLRSKPTFMKVNDDVYVHGGISSDFLSHNDFQIEQLNAIMRASIERSKEEMKASDFYKTYYGSSGPIWYRGYFNDNLEDSEISEILHKVDSDHIVVGHCSNETVVQLYDHKIYGVDSSMKYGAYGELLLIKKKKYQRRTLDGKKAKFN